MKRGRDRLQDDLLRGDLEAALDAEARAHGDQEPVVRPDEQAPALRLERDVAVLAHVRIDDRDDDGVLVDVRQRVDEEQCSGQHVERRHAVREIDDATRGRNAAHHGMADADPLVAVAEIGRTDDRPRQAVAASSHSLPHDAR